MRTDLPRIHCRERQVYRIRIIVNCVYVFSGGKLYSGTVADFSGSDALIIRDRVRTEQYDLKHLNGERAR